MSEGAGAVKVFGMCINKKVLGGLAVLGLGIWWLAPELLVAALPFLLLAICPLSMLFMMKAMNNMNQQQGQQSAPAAAVDTGPQPSAPTAEVGETTGPR